MKSYPTYLFLYLAILVNGGCQDTDVSGSQQPEQVPIALKVEAPGLSAQTKSSADALFQTSVFCSTREGDYTALGQASAGKWNAYEWNVNTEVNSSNEIVLTDKFYPPYGDNIYLMAISPQKADDDSDGILSYTLDGHMDLMYAKPIVGNRWNGYRFTGNPDPTKDRSLEYVHLLTQLVFKAKKNVSDSGLEVTVKKITVKNISATVTLPLATGEARFGGNSGTVVLEPSDAKVSPSNPGPIDLGYLYLPPMPGKGDAKITIETSIGTFSDVSLTMAGENPEDNFKAGFSHKITLDIHDKSLGISSVEVAEWTPSLVDGNLDLIH